MGHDHFVAQLRQLPAYPGGMGPGFQCDSTAGDPAENLVDSPRCRRQTVLQNHVTCFIQDAVMACSVSQIQTDGQLGFLENLVATLRHSANLLHSRSPFSCASSTSITGSVTHPVETGLLIPSGKSHNRTSTFWRRFHFSGNRVNHACGLLSSRSSSDPRKQMSAI